MMDSNHFEYFFNLFFLNSTQNLMNGVQEEVLLPFFKTKVLFSRFIILVNLRENVKKKMRKFLGLQCQQYRNDAHKI